MGLLDVRFAKLNFDYDRARALNEAMMLSDRMEVTKSLPGLPLPFSVVGEDCAVRDPMQIGLTWVSLGLTHIPGMEVSKLGRGTTRNITRIEDWVWRDDIEAPYLHQLCYELLPFERVGNVRLLALKPGSTGSVHNDDTQGLFYEGQGGRSVTLNLAAGGRLLEFQHDGKHYTISDYPAFIFRDDCWHGVPQGDDLRMQFRIHGIFRPAMADLIDKDRVLQ